MSEVLGVWVAALLMGAVWAVMAVCTASTWPRRRAREWTVTYDRPWYEWTCRRTRLARRPADTVRRMKVVGARARIDR